MTTFPCSNMGIEQTTRRDVCEMVTEDIARIVPVRLSNIEKLQIALQVDEAIELFLRTRDFRERYERRRCS